MWTPGDRVGRFELVAPLARSAAKEVWEAVLRGPGGYRRPVALKLVRSAGSPPVTDLRWRAALLHPNVVDSGVPARHEGGWHLAMALVGGAALSTFPLPLPAPVVIDVGTQAAAGLAHVHGLLAGGRSVGLVHRDVRPANLLVDPLGVVKLVDGGLAGLEGPSAGAAGYAPPEELAGTGDPRSDLFALGVTLYELATGTLPFGTGPEALQAVRDVEARLADPAFLAPLDSVPGLAEVVRRCLRHAPEDRWPDALAMGEALGGLRRRQPAEPTLRAVLARLRPDLEAEEPTLAGAPSSTVAGNLPREREGFVGRAAELRALSRAFVTPGARIGVVGPAGVGKSRLALAAASRVRRDLPGGAWLFDLSGAATVDAVCLAVARATGIVLRHDVDPVELLAQRFAALGRCLLVFDSVEEGLAALPATVGAWAQRAPEAAIVVCSREPWPLSGGSTVVVEGLTPSDGVELFRRRAPGLPADQETELLALVDALEGNPLAIELCAARVQEHPVAAVRRGVGAPPVDPAGEGGSVRPRNVVGAVAWSWAQLPPVAQAALGLLSAFEGSVRLDTAEALLHHALPPEAPHPLDLLHLLVDANLVRVEPRTGRCRLPGVVKAFVEERLAPEDRALAEQLHGEIYGRLGQRSLLASLDGPAGPEWSARLVADLENLVCAARRAIARGDGAVAAACAAAAAHGLGGAGAYGPALDLLEAALAVPALAPGARATLALAAGSAARRLGRPEIAEAWLGAAHASAASAGSLAQHAEVKTELATLRRGQGRADEALAAAIEAVEVHRLVGNRSGEAAALTVLGQVHADAGRAEEAASRLSQAVEVWRAVGSRDRAAAALDLLSALHRDLGHAREAASFAAEAAALRLEQG